MSTERFAQAVNRVKGKATMILIAHQVSRWFHLFKYFKNQYQRCGFGKDCFDM